MFSVKEMPTASSLFQTYASMTASVMLFRTLANDIIPRPLRGYLTTFIKHYFKPKPSQLTLIIEDTSGFGRNQVYDAAEIYLSTKLSSDTERLRLSKSHKEKSVTIRLEQGEKVVDIFDGVELKWKFSCSDQPEKNNDSRNPFLPPHTVDRTRFFELTFHKNNKDLVLNSYVPFFLQRAKDIKDQHRILKMHTLNTSGCGLKWDSVNLEHPSTFDTLAMDHELKNALIDDLNRFVKRKEFYKRVGKAWKRGYLLYGPPGTGKSSLVAAIANYLKFDVYDLQLANVMRDSDLRKLLLTTGNRSVLVIEDIDCSVDFPDRKHGDGKKQPDHLQLTLSGLLNFIDGLWSSCGDERIIVFTTNHKERLDPALLRPGRMDMHIHMSYCTYHGFKLLANNYLGICGHHKLFNEIEGLLDSAEVTPAQVAEELMKSEDADIALEGVVNLLKRKKMEGSELEDENVNEVGIESKRRKIEKKASRPVRITKRRKTTRKCRK